MAGAGQRRCRPPWASTPARRSHGDRRAAPARVAGRPGLGSHGGGRGDHQHRRRPDRRPRGRAPFGELDGGERCGRGGRMSLRHRSGRRGLLPRPADRDTGRQGFAVHADALERKWRRSRRRLARVAGRLRLRAGDRRGPHFHPAARHRPADGAAARGFGSGRKSASAVPFSHRLSAAAAERRPTHRRRIARPLLRCCPGSCASRTFCSPITTVPTAGCPSRSPR